MSSRRTPHDPMRMNVGRSVIARISAMTISTLSVPMPVDRHEMRLPLYVPVADANSRLRCCRSTVSKRSATLAVRSWSPGSRMYSASSPGPRPMWYWISVSGTATRRSATGNHYSCVLDSCVAERDHRHVLSVESTHSQRGEALFQRDDGLREPRSDALTPSRAGKNHHPDGGQSEGQ